MSANDLKAITNTHASANRSTLAGNQEVEINQDLNSAAMHAMWLDEAQKRLADVAAGFSSDARASILAMQTRRAKENNLLAKINQLS